MKRILIILSIICIAMVTALGVDPLPQANVSAESDYIYRKATHEIYDPVGDIDMEASTHCLFPGSGCRFTAEPQE